jgi:two-component system, OmpR family, alkaline phosphatase synthesis response regulator PhoP
MIKILLVDDEPDILDFLGYNLKKEGFDVLTANNGKDALEIVDKITPDLIILDIMMPYIDGIETCRLLREKRHLEHTLITFLTARSEESYLINALGVGGDDYFTKPISPQALVSRVKALLRRHNVKGGNDGNSLILGDIEIDQQKMSVLVGKKSIDLPRKEFELLSLLVSRPGKVFSRAEIYAKVWGATVIVSERTLDVHILKLREKIGEEYIKTVKGIRYKFNM